jgi:broad specificity phosphatase PhoE
MDIILVRHLESTKNINDTFSSEESLETLSPGAQIEGGRLADHLARFVQGRGSVVRSLHCSAAERTESTARLIAGKLNAKVLSHVELKSFSVGLLAGVSEAKASCLMPEFMHQLMLYRSGLYNSYALSLPVDSEKPRAFEDRIFAKVMEITENKNDLEIFILTRSAITAMLIAFARHAYGYPDDFYGHVPLDLGRVSWLTSTTERSWHIKGVNMDPAELLSLDQKAAARR